MKERYDLSALDDFDIRCPTARYWGGGVQLEAQEVEATITIPDSEIGAAPETVGSEVQVRLCQFHSIASSEDRLSYKLRTGHQ